MVSYTDYRFDSTSFNFFPAPFPFSYKIYLPFLSEVTIPRLTPEVSLYCTCKQFEKREKTLETRVSVDVTQGRVRVVAP